MNEHLNAGRTLPERIVNARVFDEKSKEREREDMKTREGREKIRERKGREEWKGGRGRRNHCWNVEKSTTLTQIKTCTSHLAFYISLFYILPPKSIIRKRLGLGKLVEFLPKSEVD